jgi:hypothetical protein
MRFWRLPYILGKNSNADTHPYVNRSRGMHKFRDIYFEIDNRYRDYTYGMQVHASTGLILCCTVKCVKWYLDEISSILYQVCTIFHKDHENEVYYFILFFNFSLVSI